MTTWFAEAEFSALFSPPERKFPVSINSAYRAREQRLKRNCIMYIGINIPFHLQSIIPLFSTSKLVT